MALYVLIVLLCCIPVFTVITSVINPIIFVISFILFLFMYVKNKISIKNHFISKAFIPLFLIIFTPLFFSPNKDIVFLNTLIINSSILIFILSSMNKISERKLLESILYGASLNFIISLIRYFNYTDTRLDGISNYANSSALLFFIGICMYFYITIEYGNSIINDICLFLLNSALLMTFSRSLYIIYFAFIIWLSLHFYKKVKPYFVRLLGIFVVSCLTSYLLISRYFLALILLAPLIALLLFIPNKIKNKKANYKIKPLHIGIALLLSSLPLCILFKFREINLNTFKERLVIMKDSIQIILKHPLGIGFGNYPLYQTLYSSANYETKFIHNSYLQYIADFGVVNAMLLLILLVLIFRNIIKNNIDNKKLLIFPLVAALVVGTIDFSLSNSSIIILLSILLGLLYKTENANAFNLKWIFPIISVPFFIVACILLPKQIIYNYAAIEFTNNSFENSRNILFMGQALPLENSIYYEKLGASIFNTSNNSDKDLKNIQSSINYFNKAKKLTPYDSKIYKDLGKCFLIKKDYGEAEKNFNFALIYRKYDFEAIKLLKECYERELAENTIQEDEYTLKENKLEEKCKKINTDLKDYSKFMKNQKITP